VFAVNTDRTGFTNLHTFQATLLQGPQLTISLAGTNALLMWPSVFQYIRRNVVSRFDGEFCSYRLQSTTSLWSSAVWTYVYPAPIIVNGQKILANPISGTQQFYRLILQTASTYNCDNNSDCPCGRCIFSEGTKFCIYPDGTPCDY
jgi:hypothetical protein